MSKSDQHQSAVVPLLPKEIGKLFQKHGQNFKRPSDDDLEAFCTAVNILADVEDPETSGASAPMHPFVRLARTRAAADILERSLPSVTKAAACLARELPHMNDLSRKAIIGARIHGAEPTISEGQLQALERLCAAAKASRDAFTATVFKAIGKSSPQPDWYETGRIIAFFAKTAWTNAGNRNVSIGKAAKTPVAQVTREALELIGITRSANAVSKMLSDWDLESSSQRS